MINTILVTGAGSGGAENLIASIKDINKHTRIIGTNSNELILAGSVADIHEPLIPASDCSYNIYLNRLLKKHDVDLIIPNNDKEVHAVSTYRNAFDCDVFLPDHKNIVTCQNKLSLHKKIPQYTPHTKKYIDGFEHGPKWLKLQRGSGSMASLPVNSYKEAKAWVDWWIMHRNLKSDDFIVCNVLPGRDYAVQSIWKDGICIQIKAIQRLAYIFGKNMPQNSSSSPSVSMQVYNKEVIDVCLAAVKSINHNANGLWSIDLKEDQNGTPKINEINIGRFCMILPIFNQGPTSMTATYLQCAAGLPIEPEVIPGKNIIDVVMVRELDTLPFFLYPENALEMMEKIFGHEKVHGY